MPERPLLTPTVPDLTAATRLARGHVQRRWLAEMLDHERGLRPGDGAHGKWASGVYRRVETFVWTLRCAGYVVERRPFGPRRAQRFILVGWSENYALAARAARAGAHDAIDAEGVIHPALLGLSIEQMEALARLADSWRGPVEDLAQVATRLVP